MKTLKGLALLLALGIASVVPGASRADAITRDEAKSIALRDAKLTEAEVRGYRIRNDWDHGVDTYEIEFYCKGIEYDYEIRVSDGAIVEKDWDNEGWMPNAAPVGQR
jgi:uncharacterized membrane protein YkoI